MYLKNHKLIAQYTLLFALILLTLGLIQPVTAQSAAQLTGSSQEAGKSDAPSIQVDPELASPAETMRTFLTAFPDQSINRQDRIDPQAIKTLDMPLSPPSTKVERAKILKQIMDRTKLVDYDEINNSMGSGPIYTFSTYEKGQIQIERQPNGEWLFSTATIDSLPAIWDEMQNKDVVDGVTSSPELTISQTFELSLPVELQERVLFLEAWKWLGIFIAICIGVLFDRLTVNFLTLFTAAALRKTELKLEKENIAAAVRPFGILAMAGVFKIALLVLLLPTTVDVIFNVVVRFLAAASFVWAAYKAVDGLAIYFAKLASKTETKVDDLLIPFLSKVIKIFIALFGLVFIASQLNINIASLLAGLGLGGLAFALAAKDTVENFFGSLTVLIDQPFRVGDWIVVENGTEGEVESVGLRSTRVRTFYNSLITVPNSRLISSTVDNYGMRKLRRWKTTLSLTYDTPPEKIEAFCQGCRELILKQPHTHKSKFFVYANEYNAYSLDILFYMFFDVPNWGAELEARHNLFLDILRLAKVVGVEFAFPTQTLHISRGVPTHDDAPLNLQEAAMKGAEIAQRVSQENVHNVCGLTLKSMKRRKRNGGLLKPKKP